jgi:hypothetical protein
MIGDTERDCRRRPKRFMHTAEVVMRELERDGRAVIFKFLAERIGKAREASAGHTQREVSALGIAR